MNITSPALPATYDLDWDKDEEITDVNQRARDSEMSPAAESPRKATLVVLRGLEAGRMFTLDPEVTLIGRDRSAQVHYDDKGLSRKHARIVVREGRYFIEDLGSRNGTYVDGARVQRAELRDGERIALSATVVLRFSLVDEVEELISKQLFEASTRDALTGVFNRRYLDERLAAEVSFAHRHKGELGVLMFDIDHFKKVNDEHGHLAGDAVLRAVARRVGSLIRAEDVLGRYGGEEFVILARGVPRDGLVRLAERVRRTISELPIDVSGKVQHVTVSVGTATLAECDAHATGDLLLAHVDERLYAAKAAGRNRVCTE